MFLFLFLTMVHGDLKVPWSMKPSKAGWNVHHPAPSQCLHVCPGHGQSRHQGSTWESAGLNKKLPCLNYQDTILNHSIEKSNIYIYIYICVHTCIYIYIYTYIYIYIHSVYIYIYYGDKPVNILWININHVDILVLYGGIKLSQNWGYQKVFDSR